MPRHITTLVTIPLFLGCTVAPLLDAQQKISAWRPNRGDGLLGAELNLVQPRGELAQHVGLKPALTLSGGYTVDRYGVLQLGGEMRILNYDEKEIDETERIKNIMRTVAVNGRLMLPVNYVHPYIGGSIGAAYWATETEVWRCCSEEGDYEWQLERLSLPRLTYTLSRSAGVVIDVLWLHRNRPSSSTISLDLGVADHLGGRVSYHTSGRDERTKSRTDYRVWRLGMTLRGR